MKLKDFITEGGAALKDANVNRIKKEDVPATIRYVAKISGIKLQDLHPLGSTGKTATSGDIDLAVSIQDYDPEKVHERIITALDDALGGGKERYGVFNKGTKVGSYAVPIKGYTSELVQVDLMYVPNTEWAKFSYFSAGDASKYKGAIRNILLAAAAASLNEKGKDTFVYDGEELIVRVSRGIDPNVGLKRIMQMRPRKKTGQGYVKTMKKASAEEIKQMFPDLEFDGSNLIVDDPAEVVKIIFGPKTTPKDVESVEKILSLIKTLPKKRKEKIFDIAKKRADALQKKGFNLPTELE